MVRRTRTVEFAFVLLAAGLCCSAGQRAGKEGLCDASSGAEGCGPPPESSDSVYEHSERSDLATLLQVKVNLGDGRGSGLAQDEDRDVRDAAVIGANVGSERRLLTKRDGFSSRECTEKKWKSDHVCPWFTYNGHSNTGTAKKCAEFCDTKSGTKKVGDTAPSFSQSVNAFYFSFNKENGDCRCCFKSAEYVKNKAWDSWRCTADPVPCSLSDWSDWTVCSQSCGGGARGRSRKVTKAAKYNGACEEDLEESEACAAPCPVDCVLSEWSEWSACSATCGHGTKTRSRSVSVDAQHGGRACEGALEASENCKDKECVIHCELSDWTGWGACSTTCGEGTRSRSRSVNVEAKHGGQACEDALDASEQCKDRECPVHCVMNAWSDWTECSESCGEGGSIWRHRSVSTPAQHDGKQCGGTDEKEQCSAPDCPVAGATADPANTSLPACKGDSTQWKSGLGHSCAYYAGKVVIKGVWGSCVSAWHTGTDGLKPNEACVECEECQ